MDGEVLLFDLKTIDSLPWPDTEEAEYAKRYLVPFIKNGARHYIDNVETTMMALLIDELVLPITINESEYENSHVCSPYTHFVSVASKKVAELKTSILRTPLLGILKLFEMCFHKCKINRVICVNNWLQTTNLYPKLTHDQVNRITEKLRMAFPTHSILFKSVHDYGELNIKPLFQKNNYALIASRQVFFTDTQKDHAFRSRMFKSDLKLLQSSDYTIVTHDELSHTDTPRMENLYNSLYHEKHSLHSPKLNQNFFKLLLENKLYSIKALKKEGAIEGLTAYFSVNGMVTSPIFGYDVTKEEGLDVYRMLSVLLLLDAKEKKMVLNHSSGASSHKKLRRAESSIEYMAVYHEHLPFLQRLPWITLGFVMNRVGIHVMKYF